MITSTLGSRVPNLQEEQNTVQKGLVLNILLLNQIYFSICTQSHPGQCPPPSFPALPTHMSLDGAEARTLLELFSLPLQAPGLNYFSLRTAFLWLLEYELRPVATSLMFPLKRFHHQIHVGQIAFRHFFLPQALVPLIQVTKSMQTGC